MSYEAIAISSGHSTRCQGMDDIINEVEEATRVSDKVGELLRARGCHAPVFHDTVSIDKNECLDRICDWHNSQVRDVDISVHFNANVHTSKPVGTEVWYYSQQELAARLATAIADNSGLIDRGPKYSDGLYFLSHTSQPAVLIEVCFGDSQADVDAYRAYFDMICEGIADVLGGEETSEPEQPEQPEQPEGALFSATGKCSYFGGPEDTTGMTDDEGLAFIYDVMDAPHLFLPEGTPGTEGMGLARKLNPFVHYCACRWDYNITPKPHLLQDMALVTASKTGISLTAWPADWGPNSQTNRIADLSPSLMRDLGIETDDEVTVIFPYREDVA